MVNKCLEVLPFGFIQHTYARQDQRLTAKFRKSPRRDHLQRPVLLNEQYHRTTIRGKKFFRGVVAALRREIHAHGMKWSSWRIQSLFVSFDPRENLFSCGSKETKRLCIRHELHFIPWACISLRRAATTPRKNFFPL